MFLCGMPSEETLLQGRSYERSNEVIARAANLLAGRAFERAAALYVKGLFEIRKRRVGDRRQRTACGHRIAAPRRPRLP
jgi:hypothetical protein